MPSSAPSSTSAAAPLLRPVRPAALALLVLALALSLAALGPATSASAAAPAAPAVAPSVGAVSVAAQARRGKKRSSRAARIGRATGIALNQLGDPYRWGSTGPNSFDCSGLIYYSFRRAGVSVPRTSSQQAGAVRRIKKSNLRRGDLMFFHNSGRVYHVGVFLGRKNGRVRMVSAPSTGKRVERSSPWTSSWFAGTLRRR